MSASRPAVVLMARAPRRGTVHQALEPVLGADRCATLHSVLLRMTAEWAQSVGERLYVAYEPADARTELTALLGSAPTFLPQSGDGIATRTASVCAQVFAAGERPVLVVWPSVARLRPAHGAAALADLRSGADLVLGPVLDGGLYLIGVPGPVPALFGLAEQTWRSPELVNQALAAGHKAGLEVGLLRAERALHRPADARAALADPLLAPELAAILERAR